MENTPVLYIKTGCPWCDDALSFFHSCGLAPLVQDVLKDPAAMARMKAISGQDKCPTFEYDGFVVADFSVQEFLAAIAQAPHIRQALSL